MSERTNPPSPNLNERLSRAQRINDAAFDLAVRTLATSGHVGYSRHIPGAPQRSVLTTGLLAIGEPERFGEEPAVRLPAIRLSVSKEDVYPRHDVPYTDIKRGNAERAQRNLRAALGNITFEAYMLATGHTLLSGHKALLSPRPIAEVEAPGRWTEKWRRLSARDGSSFHTPDMHMYNALVARDVLLWGIPHPDFEAETYACVPLRHDVRSWLSSEGVDETGVQGIESLLPGLVKATQFIQQANTLALPVRDIPDAANFRTA